MASATTKDIDELVVEFGQRAAFVRAQCMAGVDEAILFSSQAAALCGRLNAVGQLPMGAATRLTEAITAGPWKAEQVAALAAAVGEATLRAAAPAAGTRRLQSAPTIDCYLTAADVQALTAHSPGVGDAGSLVGIVCRRAWAVGITCPSEKLSVRMAAIVAAVGMGGVALSASSRLNLLRQVKACVKQLDRDRRHPFPHLLALPAKPSDLGLERLAFAYGSDGAGPTGLGAESAAAVDAAVMQAPARNTHTALRAWPLQNACVPSTAQAHPGSAMQASRPAFGQMPVAMHEAMCNLVAWFAQGGAQTGAGPSGVAPPPHAGLQMLRPRAVATAAGGPPPAALADGSVGSAEVAGEEDSAPLSTGSGSMPGVSTPSSSTPALSRSPSTPALARAASALDLTPVDDGEATVDAMEREQLMVAKAKQANADKRVAEPSSRACSRKGNGGNAQGGDAKADKQVALPSSRACSHKGNGGKGGNAQGGNAKGGNAKGGKAKGGKGKASKAAPAQAKASAAPALGKKRASAAPAQASEEHPPKKPKALFLGCGKCRGAPAGCIQCRNPAFMGARWKR